MTKILVVDDSPTMRQQVRHALEASDFTIDEAVDGEDALQKIRANDDFSVVILDVSMPRMNGIEVVETLGAEGLIVDGLQVLMLTTEGHVDMINRAKAAGAKGWMVKPFKPQMLLAAVQRLAA